MVPRKPAFYVHSEHDIVSHQISSSVASDFGPQSSSQWLSRAGPSVPTTRSINNAASEFYANYPIPPEDDLDDVVPPLPSFDENITEHFLQAGLPGIAVKHVPKCYADSV